MMCVPYAFKTFYEYLIINLINYCKYMYLFNPNAFIILEFTTHNVSVIW